MCAQTAAHAFEAYYEPFLARLRPVLAATHVAKDMRKLRGRCVEAISLIGAAVGRERFRADALAVMEDMVRASAASAAAAANGGGAT